MSQNLVAYLEINDPDTKRFVNITNRNTYDGYEFGQPQMFPVINYATPENEIKHARHLEGLPVTNITSGELAKETYDLYQANSNEITGLDNGLGIYSITVADLVEYYNKLVAQKPAGKTPSVLLQMVAHVIAALANGYYYQLGGAAEVLDMLIPNYQRKLYPDDEWNDIRLVGWFEWKKIQKETLLWYSTKMYKTVTKLSKLIPIFMMKVSKAELNTSNDLNRPLYINWLTSNLLILTTIKIWRQRFKNS